MASGLPEKIRSRLVLEVGLIINTSSSIMSCKDSFIAIKLPNTIWLKVVDWDCIFPHLGFKCGSNFWTFVEMLVTHLGNVWHCVSSLQTSSSVKCFNHSISMQNFPISTQENFPRKEQFVKCDWPTQIFDRKKILKLKIFNF